MFPHVFFALLSVELFCIASAILFALFLPVGFHLLTLAAAVYLTVAAWRNHDASPGSAGLPPGSLSIARSIAALPDRRYYQEQTRRHGPVFKMAQFHRRVICVTGIERSHKLFRDHASSIGPCPLPFSSEISGGFLRYMNDETYERYGPAFRRALSGPIALSAVNTTRSTTKRQLTLMATDCGKSSEGRGVRPAAYVAEIVHDALAAALFGSTPDSDSYNEMKTLFSVMDEQDLNRRLSRNTKSALADLRSLVEKEVERLQSRSDHGEPACALTELHRTDPQMPDAVCIDNLIFIFKFSTANVPGLLHWILQLLGENPDWIGRIRQERKEATDSRKNDIVNRVIMETLRLAQSEYLYRTIKSDFEFEGFRFPRGWLIRHCVWESHRDPRIFENAERFDPDRHLLEDFPRQEYSPFGCPHHGCNGVVLTYMIARTFIEELAGYDWIASGDSKPERDFRHWSHWRPGAGFGVILRPVQSESAESAESPRHAERS